MMLQSSVCNRAELLCIAEGAIMVDTEKSVVDRVVDDFCEGNKSELARQLTLRTKKYVSRQQVHGWIERGQFPPEWIDAVHAWTRIPLRDLLHRTRPRS